MMCLSKRRHLSPSSFFIYLQLKKKNQKNKLTKVVENRFISKGKKNGRKEMLPKMYLKYQKKKKKKKTKKNTYSAKLEHDRLH